MYSPFPPGTPNDDKYFVEHNCYGTGKAVSWHILSFWVINSWSNQLNLDDYHDIVA
jgi:hypothetical protein